MRRVNQAGIDLIKHYESLHDGDLSQIGLQPKMCPAGIWTVGYGRALSIQGKLLRGLGNQEQAYRMYPNLTPGQAEAMLAEDLTTFASAVESLIRVPVTDNQFAALVSLAYNIGTGAFSTSTALRRLNLGDYEGSAEAILKFVKSGGKVLRGLQRRRAAEKDLFLSPE